MSKEIIVSNDCCDYKLESGCLLYNDERGTGNNAWGEVQIFEHFSKGDIAYMKKQFKQDLEAVRECFFGSPSVGAIFLEGTFYNKDIGTFVPFVFLLENYPTGAVYTSHEIIARELLPYQGYQDMKWEITLQVIVVLVSLYYLREEVDQMFDHYPDEYYFQAPKFWYG
mgnify:CR=1 FL=1